MVEDSQDQDPYVLGQIAARDRSAVTKISFLNFRSRYPEGMVFTVEGDDDKIVYSYWIQRVSPGIAYEFYVCSGKREVRKLVNSLSRDLSDVGRNVAFLVDRDFDDLDGFESRHQVFMLDRYSIENYLVDRGVVDETLRVAFPGSGDRYLREKICCLFDEDYCKFLGVVLELNRRVFIARRLRIDIDDLLPDSLSKLATVGLGQVAPCNPPAEDALQSILGVRTAYAGQLGTEFGELDPTTRYRGKFLYRFLRGWFERLCDEYRNARHGLFPPDDGRNCKIKHDEMSLGSLASRSPIPEGLSTFIAQLGFAR